MKKKVIFIIVTFCIFVLATFNTFADVMYGDITGDNAINAEDALAVLKHAADLDRIEDVDINKADVIGDGVVNAADALEILKYAAGIIDEFEYIAEVIPEPELTPEPTPEPVEINVDKEQIKVVKAGPAMDKSYVITLTSASDYQDYVAKISESHYNAFGNNTEEVANYFSEDNFINQNILAVYISNYTSGQYRQAFSKLVYDSDKDLYTVYINTYTGVTVPPDTGSWCVFIPVDKSIDSDIKCSIETEYLWEENTVFYYTDSGIKTIKLDEAINLPEAVTELKSYEEYKNYVNTLLTEYPEAFEGKADEILAYYDEDFFDRGSVASIYIEETDSADYEIDFQSFLYSGGKYNYKFNILSAGNNTEGTVGWLMFTAVPKIYLKDGYQLDILKVYKK